MTLASEAMKGLNKAETEINKEKPKTATPATKKPVQEKKIELTPEQQKAVADMLALKRFIEGNHLGISDGKKNYVKAEVYQYIAQQKHLLPTFLTEDGFREDGVYFCKTTCILRKTDTMEEISRSTMLAEKSEDWASKLDNFAVMGLSETRAMARAVKNIYGYLLTAIGYQATPFEEINEKKGKK